MMRCSLPIVLLITMTVTAADKPSRVEIAKKTKAATAFLEHARGTGTAFCVHSSGLFVTNEHVIRTAENGNVTVVLNPSQEGQRVLKAKVIRTDKVLDLALLRVEGVKDLPALPFGSTKDLTELADVVACGFPQGKGLAIDRKDYPAVSVNAGTITSLKYKEKILDAIQIDISLSYGNSGGPVVDDRGAVVGVVTRGVAGGRGGINEAIPVNQLIRFLMSPDIALTVPTIVRADTGKPTEFNAKVVTLIPGATEPILKLIVQAGDEQPREFPMKKMGDSFTATAIPIAKTSTRLVELTARFGTGSITGLAPDSVFTIAAKPYRLSSVRSIELGDKPLVQLLDGKTVPGGVIEGLGKTEFEIGMQKISIDLSKASKIAVQTLPETSTIRVTVVASTDNREVGRIEERIDIHDANVLAPVDTSSVVISAPSLAETKVVKRLPEAFSDVVVGGGGRYLIFNMPKLMKLAIFDINELKITKYIPLAEEDITYTAGLDSIVIGLKKAGRLERWSLTTFELEKSAPPPFTDAITGVLMGHASNGPVIANGFGLDLATFKKLPIFGLNGNDRPFGSALGKYASGDSTVFCAWKSNQSPVETAAFVYEDGTVKRHEGGELMHAIPGPDGRTIYTAKGIVSRTLSRGDPEDAAYGYCLPAVRGDYFLSLTSANGGKGGGFTVYLRGLKQPIARMDKADHGIGFNGWDREVFGPWKRVFYVPDAKVIAVLPASNDQVVLHKIDVEAELEKSGIEYLLVTSLPPTAVKTGTTLTYALKVKAKDKKITYALDSGPEGMTISREGVLTWPVPADAPAGEQSVILTVRDSKGQEMFHTFKLKVTK